jgi:hypothetical protein
LPYYQEKYGISEKFIEAQSMLATKNNLKMIPNTVLDMNIVEL